MYPGVPPLAVGLPPMVIELPLQMLWLFPALAVGLGRTPTVKLLPLPLPQELLGVTVTSPAAEPQVTVIEVVPWPRVMLASAGTVQV